MENEKENNSSFSDILKDKLREKSRYLISLIVLLCLIIFGFIGLDILKDKKNEKTAEKYIQAGLLFSQKELESAKRLYLEVIDDENKFYSLLALNNIIEKNLIEDTEKVLELFKKIENIKTEKTHKDLIKLKKALYLMKSSKLEESKKLLNEIIENNSVWKEVALDILK